MKLAYQAYDQAGNPVRGVVDAADEHEAAAVLHERGLFISQFEPANGDERLNRGSQSTGAISGGRLVGTSGGVPGGGVSGGRRLKHLTMFTRQLYLLVGSGTPVAAALGALEQQSSDPKWREVVRSLRRGVEQGLSLSQAMEAQGGVFDSVYRSLIAMGESSGQFTTMLGHLADLCRKRLHTRNSIMGAVMYPVLLLGMSLVVLGVMLVFVLPKFVELFESMDVPVPPTTVVLVALSDFLRGYWWAVAAMAAAGGVGIWKFSKTEAGKRWIDGAVLRVPVFGKIIRGFATGRLVRVLGVLLESHVPVLEAMALCREAAWNSRYRELIDKAQRELKRGQPMCGAFRDPFLIAPSVYEAISNGEQSGRIGSVLVNVAGFLDDENEIVLRTLTSLIEPIILIGLGLLVGLIAVSMFMPLFDLTAMATGGPP